MSTGPVSGVSNPFYISCSSLVIPDDPDDPNPDPRELTELEFISILDPAYNEFFIGVYDDGDDDDDDTSSEWYCLGIEVKSVDPPHHMLTVDGLKYYGFYSSTIFPDSSITYLDSNMVSHTVKTWEEMPEPDDPNFFKVYNFSPTKMENVPVKYYVEAIIQQGSSGTPFIISKTLIQRVANDWTRGRDALLRYTQ
ncbi:hypothetical protein [Vibrio phage BONAISHI]|nr:hypothetical protein [Vibrio phage BONAISHI]